MEPLKKQLRKIEADLRIATLERDDAQDAVDKIISDLISTEAELEDAKREMADQKAEILALRDQLARHPPTANAKDRHQQSHGRQQTDLIDLFSQEYDSPPASFAAQNDTELVDLQQRLPTHGNDSGGPRYRPPQVRDLEAQIKSKDKTLEQKDQELAEYAALRDQMKEVDAANKKCQASLRDELKQKNALIADLKRKRVEGVLGGQEGLFGFAICPNCECSHGASPHVIPAEIFTPFNEDPLTAGSGFKQDQKSDVTELTAWCTDASRVRLAKAANLTQRYYLERATKLKKPPRRQRQIAQLRKAERLLEVPYFLVGQSLATELLTKRLLTHLMMPSKEPLVLCFAGPSGHGKTELARQLEHLLSLPLEKVDCTSVNYEMELFGPREPYVGANKGSPLNNFLVDHSGKRCIVFFDEFEKTTEKIHQALLLPFENDSTVVNFCEQNSKIFDGNEVEKSQLSKQLSRQLRETFLHRFKPPLTGRVSDFIPFLPFSPGEQAVITHKILLGLAEDLRRPINISEGSSEQRVGDIRLKIRREATVCRLLAEEHYHKNLGARSLKTGARKVKDIVVKAYLDEEEEIQENGGLQDFIIDVQGDEIVGRAGQRSS
ncbi:hypothetical protein ACHAPT_012768 [Fusarium lateritium]